MYLFEGGLEDLRKGGILYLGNEWHHMRLLLPEDLVGETDG